MPLWQRNSRSNRSDRPLPSGTWSTPRSHRATFEQQWTYTFPKHHSKRWVIALRYPPELAWSKDVQGKAELLTSTGWMPFKEVREGSPEKTPHGGHRLSAR